MNRKAKQRKTDRIDAKKMVCALLAHDRGDAAVLSQVRVPSVEEEDHKRLLREAGRDAGGGGGAAEPATTTEGDSIMRTGRMFHRDAQTFLVHLFDRNLDDERYVVETYRSLPGGELRPVGAGHPPLCRTRW